MVPSCDSNLAHCKHMVVRLCRRSIHTDYFSRSPLNYETLTQRVAELSFSKKMSRSLILDYIRATRELQSMEKASRKTLNTDLKPAERLAKSLDLKVGISSGQLERHLWNFIKQHWAQCVEDNEIVASYVNTEHHVDIGRCFELVKSNFERDMAQSVVQVDPVSILLRRLLRLKDYQNCIGLLDATLNSKNFTDFKKTEIKLPSPIMGVAHSEHTTYAGCWDGTVRQFDYENTRMTSPIVTTQVRDTSSSITHIQFADTNLMIFTTIDGLIYYYDPRLRRIVDKHDCSSKLFAMDSSPQILTVGLADNQVQLYDLRKRESPWQCRTSGLKYQMTSIRQFPSEAGYAVSGIDGRVCIDYNDLSEEAQSLKYAFKCHREKDKESHTDTVYPVTNLRFHKQYNSLFTTGGDGHICVWDWVRRRRMRQFPKIAENLAISHFDISYDGSLMAVGLSDDAYLRLSDTDAPFIPKSGKVFFKRIEAMECKPKESNSQVAS
ncbi:hypothetical protein RJF_3230 [Candidozyma auris]